MSANIEQFEDGTSAFFSARQVAWHQLGTVTPDALTAQDALATAQLDWQVKVSEAPVSVEVDGTTISVPDKFLTYRNHPKAGIAALGVVGNRYTPVQNSEAFDFLNYLVDESGAKFETAGSLGNGERVFMTMKFPESLEIAGVDTVNQYLMAVNSHDGSTSFSIAVTPVRAVCTNTVRLALRNAVAKVSLKHTAGVTSKVQQARETLGVVWRYQAEFEQEAKRLLDTPMSDIDFQAFVERLVPEPRKDASQREITTRERKREEILAIWKAPTQANVANTAWAAYNTVAEWADWAMPTRGSENKDLARAERIMMGGVDAIKERAQLLLA